MIPKELKSLLVGLEVSLKAKAKEREAEAGAEHECDEDLAGRELLASHKLSKKQVEAFARMKEAADLMHEKLQQVYKLYQATITKRERVWDELKEQYPELDGRFGHYNEDKKTLEVYGPKPSSDTDDEDDQDDNSFSLKDLIEALSE